MLIKQVQQHINSLGLVPPQSDHTSEDLYGHGKKCKYIQNLVKCIKFT